MRRACYKVLYFMPPAWRDCRGHFCSFAVFWRCAALGPYFFAAAGRLPFAGALYRDSRTSSDAIEISGAAAKTYTSMLFFSCCATIPARLALLNTPRLCSKCPRFPVIWYEHFWLFPRFGNTTYSPPRNIDANAYGIFARLLTKTI